MTGRCTGGQHHPPAEGGHCPCGVVSRHPVAVPVRAGDEELVAALAEALPHTDWCNRTASVLDDDDIACANYRLLTAQHLLLPTVRRVAEQRAAEELRAAAEELARKFGGRPGLVDADDLRARAAALTATPNHGRSATT